MFRDGHQDLHSHGDTRDLCQGVRHRPGRCPQRAQVGDGMEPPSEGENQKVKTGRGQRGSRHGVDGSQEEEGQDVLNVVNMSSVGGEQTHVITIVMAVYTLQ